MKKILITGASSGIGKDLTKIFAKRNDIEKIYILARSKDKLNFLKEELQKENSKIEYEILIYDLADAKNLENLYNYDIDLLINCAGFGKITKYSALNEEEDLNSINVNFISPMLLTKKYSQKFLEQGAGTIVNICSTAALYQHPYMAIYSSVKSALLHYSLALDEELSHINKNVRVLSVCPGPTDTNFFDKEIQIKFGASQKFMMSSESVAKKIYQDINKKKRFSVIGFRNKFSMFLLNLLPISWQLKIVGKILKRVVK